MLLSLSFVPKQAKMCHNEWSNIITQILKVSLEAGPIIWLLDLHRSTFYIYRLGQYLESFPEEPRNKSKGTIIIG